MNQEKRSDRTVKVVAIVRGEDRTTTYKRTKGLAELETELGATAWSVLSSPTNSHRLLYAFFYDAFVQLTIEQKIQDWTLTLYNQDVRELPSFSKANVFNLKTGQVVKEVKKAEVAPGIDKLGKRVELIEEDISEIQEDIKELQERAIEPVPVTEEKIEEIKVPEKKVEAPPIEAPPVKVPPIEKPKVKKEIEQLVLGSTLDLSKGVKFLSKRLKQGTELRLAKEKAINGMVPQIIFRDDEYTPSKARDNVEQFLKDDIDILFSPVGSPTLEAYLDLVEAGQVLILFPNTGAPIFRKPELKNMIHYRVGYDV